MSAFMQSFLALRERKDYAGIISKKGLTRLREGK